MSSDIIRKAVDVWKEYDMGIVEGVGGYWSDIEWECIPGFVVAATAHYNGKPELSVWTHTQFLELVADIERDMEEES